jgi:hypothetical protein
VPPHLGGGLHVRRCHGGASEGEGDHAYQRRGKKEAGVKLIFHRSSLYLKPKIIILIGAVSANKFDKKRSVFQQIWFFQYPPAKRGHFACLPNGKAPIVTISIDSKPKAAAFAPRAILKDLSSSSVKKDGG